MASLVSKVAKTVTKVPGLFWNGIDSKRRCGIKDDMAELILMELRTDISGYSRVGIAGKGIDLGCSRRIVSIRCRSVRCCYRSDWTWSRYSILVMVV